MGKSNSFCLRLAATLPLKGMPPTAAIMNKGVADDTLLNTPEHCRIIQGMSWWAVGTGLLGISHGHTAMGTGVLIGSGIAYAYWWRPTYSWRRRLDMTWVQVLLWWHLYAALESPVRIPYYTISAAGAGCYALSWGASMQGWQWTSTVFHMLLTACANLSLTVLYSGTPAAGARTENLIDDL